MYPANLNSPAALKTYLDHLATNHADVQAHIHGNVARLQAHFNSKDAKACVLFSEWPSIRYRDQGGSIDQRWFTGISILQPQKPDAWAAQDLAHSNIAGIVNDFIIRMRRDAFERSWVFRIEELGQIDPVSWYQMDNCFGYRFEMYIGDWVAVGVNEAKWADLAE